MDSPLGEPHAPHSRYAPPAIPDGTIGTLCLHQRRIPRYIAYSPDVECVLRIMVSPRFVRSVSFSPALSPTAAYGRMQTLSPANSAGELPTLTAVPIAVATRVGVEDNVSTEEHIRKSTLGGQNTTLLDHVPPTATAFLWSSVCDVADGLLPAAIGPSGEQHVRGGAGPAIKRRDDGGGGQGSLADFLSNVIHEATIK